MAPTRFESPSKCVLCDKLLTNYKCTLLPCNCQLCRGCLEQSKSYRNCLQCRRLLVKCMEQDLQNKKEMIWDIEDLNDRNSVTERVMCPYENSHNIEKTKLLGHLLKCYKSHPYVKLTVPEAYKIAVGEPL